jgi:hypothetical protein
MATLFMVHILVCIAPLASTGAMASFNGKDYTQSRSISKKSEHSSLTESWRCDMTLLTGTAKMNR